MPGKAGKLVVKGIFVGICDMTQLISVKGVDSHGCVDVLKALFGHKVYSFSVSCSGDLHV